MTEPSEATRLLVLGPVELEVGGRRTHSPGARPDRLLRVLALAGPDGRSADALAEGLWPSAPPARPRPALQMLVSRIRAVAPGLIITTAEGYRIADCDLWLAEAAATAIPGEALATVESMSAALALWRGTPDADGADDAAGIAERAAAAEARLRGARSAALLRLGRAAEALSDAEALLALRPLDAAAVGLRMRTLAATGRSSEALAVFAKHREGLAEAFGADPDRELVELNARLLSAPRGRALGLVAAPNTLRGRELELDELAAALSTNPLPTSTRPATAPSSTPPEHRLVTVLGPGGLGKTRVAQAVAERLRPQRDLVVVAELAGAASADDLLPVLGSSLGLREAHVRRLGDPVRAAELRSRVVETLRGGETLLVLDNCEHLVDAVALIARELLAQAPRLRILATSRVPLGIAGELEFALSPLAEAGAELFVERARAIRPGAALDPELVRRVVAGVDGLPLAIELAAARIRTMSLPELTARLGDRLTLLVGGDRSAPERHRTLFAVIDWSRRLLSAPAQHALARLALPPDGVSPELAAELLAVLAVDPERVLDELVAQSLLLVQEPRPGVLRFRMLETIREFGLRLLVESDEREAAQTAMDAWARRLARDGDLDCFAPDSRTGMLAVADDEENLLAVLRRPQAGREAIVIELLGLLVELWTMREHDEAVRANAGRLFDAIRCGGAQDADPDSLAMALTSVAVTSLLDGRGTATRAIALLRRERRGRSAPNDVWAEIGVALTLPPEAATARLLALSEHPDPRVSTMGMLARAAMLENGGDLDAAEAMLERARALAEAKRLDRATLQAEASLAQLLSQRGRREEAITAAGRAQREFRAAGMTGDLAKLEWYLVVNRIALGDLTAAERYLDEPQDGVQYTEPGIDGYRAMRELIRAELAIARGEDAAAMLREAVDALGPNRALQPLAAEARAEALCWAAAQPSLTDPDREWMTGCARRLRSRSLGWARVQRFMLDVPVLGAVAVGLGSWLATPHERRSTEQREAGLRLAGFGAACSARRELPLLAAATPEPTAGLGQQEAADAVIRALGEAEPWRSLGLRPGACTAAR